MKKFLYFIVFQILEKIKPPPKILLYHQFSCNHAYRKISKDTFHTQLNYLTKYSSVIPLTDFLKSKKPNAFAITIDDGYKNFLNIAYPLIKKYQIPVTLFITTDFLLNKDWFWFDKLDYLFNNTSIKETTLSINESKYPITLLTQKDIHQSLERIADILFTNYPTINKNLQILSNTLQIPIPQTPPEQYAFISVDELKKLNEDPLITIGSHSTLHEDLTQLSEKKCEETLLQSKIELESILNTTVNLVSYPYGQKEHINDSIVKITKKYYDYAFTAFPSKKETSPHLIGRKTISSHLIEFKKSIHYP